MALSPPLTPLEKRTAVLLTIIGIMGSLLGIVIAVPYFFLHISVLAWCDDAAVCGDVKTNEVLARHIYYMTASIVILSIVASFLPRIIYGFRLRKNRRREPERTKDGSR